MPGVRLDFLPQMADMHVQAVLVPVIVRTPDGLANGIIGYDVPAVIGQPLQQGALGGGQRQGHAVGAVHGSIVQIDLAVPQLQGRRGGASQFGPVGALQNMLDAQEQFLHQKGLGQVVVRAKAQPQQAVSVSVSSRKEQRGHISLGVQLAQ